MNRVVGVGGDAASGQSIPSFAQTVSLGGFSGEGVLERPGAIFDENALEDVCAAGKRPCRPAMPSWIILCGLLAFSITTAVAQESPAGGALEPRAVPAEFVRFINPPGSENGFLRPSTILFDRKAGELYVADAGNRRIVIFGEDGAYRYEFSGGVISAPIDMAIDSDGYLYVLDSTTEGKKILVHDFDGLFVREMNIAFPPDSLDSDPTSIAFDAENNLYVFDEANLRICSFDRAGTPRGAFSLFQDLGGQTRSELVVGSIRIDEGLLLVPVSILGSVYIYSLDGALRNVIGHQGSTPGALSFPVAAVITDKVLLVLDKHRFNVVCFDLAGRFLGEFGGRGVSPGWFYHPTLLDVDSKGDAYIGQVFLNRVQVCRIPDFVLAGAHHGEPGGSRRASEGASHAG